MWKRGCYVRTDEDEYWIPALEDVECIDTTGAGDSFAAGFMSALLAGRKCNRMCRRRQ